MMQTQKTPTDPDLVAADAALRRAALSAKKLAEQLGTPYVVCKSLEKILTVTNDQPAKK
ncbi:MAG: hypothetical protein Q8K80_03775 [Methylotenera sp.]|nr:hypothetical protein [Methylotenera sp.]MDP1754634.1 hypothetical protein [Methylotenera sp.]MDP1959890.1 hypothetical protein [Methylotenera sp.]MDP3942035.1 hypothetical protein [Methylotenera sp.]